MTAIRKDRVAAVEWLLANGADANAEYGDQIGPLEVALYRPNPEVVRLLLRAGARLRKKVRPYYALRLESCLKALGRQ
jgi:ankyrin repeat protein